MSLRRCILSGYINVGEEHGVCVHDLLMLAGLTMGGGQNRRRNAIPFTTLSR